MSFIKDFIKRSETYQNISEYITEAVETIKSNMDFDDITDYLIINFDAKIIFPLKLTFQRFKQGKYDTLIAILLIAIIIIFVLLGLYYIFV